MNYGKNFIDLLDELREMPEHKRLEKIRHLNVSLEIFNANYRELIHHLEIHNNPRIAFELMGQDKRHILHAFQIEITRFLHNYIASALSLTDHTRNHYRELYSDGSFPDYQDEIDKRFTKNPLAIFIKDLRQYLQHFKMPGLSSSFVFKQGAPDFEMTMNITKDDLNKFSGWKALSKQFINQHQDDFDLLSLVKDYHNHIEDFYNWFISRQTEIHKNDLIKVNQVKQKMRENEFGRFISELIKSPKTVEEFEQDLLLLFPEEIPSINESKNKAEKIEKILKLLASRNIKTKHVEEKISKIYQ